MKEVKLDQSLKYQGIENKMKLQVFVVDKANAVHLVLERSPQEIKEYGTLRKFAEGLADETGLVDRNACWQGIMDAWHGTNNKTCEIKLERITCEQTEAEEAICKICDEYDIVLKQMIIQEETLVVPDPIVLIRTIKGAYKVPVNVYRGDQHADTGEELEFKVKRMMRIGPNAEIKLRLPPDWTVGLVLNKTVEKKDSLSLQNIKPLTVLYATVVSPDASKSSSSARTPV